jgi:hypothetical protein
MCAGAWDLYFVAFLEFPDTLDFCVAIFLGWTGFSKFDLICFFLLRAGTSDLDFAAFVICRASLVLDNSHSEVACF